MTNPEPVHSYPRQGIRTAGGLRVALLATVLLVLGGAGCSAYCAGRSFMSDQDEAAQGARLNAQVLAQYRVYDDPQLQAYVQHVGAALAAHSDRPGLDYHFTVLDSTEVNAFALPGGYIYITRGILAYLNSEAELAAVLGHEIGHVTAHHAARQQSAAQVANVGALLASAFIPNLAGQIVGQQVLGTLGDALVSGYGREQELEADRLGAEYMARTGYDPRAMMDVLRTLKAQELYEWKAARAEGRTPHVYHGVFATHPDNDTRLKQAVDVSGKLQAGDSRYIGRNQYLEHINGMVFGPDDTLGVLRGRDYYQGDPGFALRFPRGWTLDNSAFRVVATAPGDAAVLQAMTLSVGSLNDARAFLHSQLPATSIKNEQPLSTHGEAGLTAVAQVQTNIGPRLARISIVVVGGRACLLVGFTRAADTMNIYDGAFLAAARSLRPLSAGERSLAAPVKRIQVIRADDNTSFQALARQSALLQRPEQQLELLNGRYPDQGPAPGDLVKTVR